MANFWTRSLSLDQIGKSFNVYSLTNKRSSVFGRWNEFYTVCSVEFEKMYQTRGGRSLSAPGLDAPVPEQRNTIACTDELTKAQNNDQVSMQISPSTLDGSSTAVVSASAGEELSAHDLSSDSELSLGLASSPALSRQPLPEVFEMEIDHAPAITPVASPQLHFYTTPSSHNRPPAAALRTPSRSKIFLSPAFSPQQHLSVPCLTPIQAPFVSLPCMSGSPITPVQTFDNLHTTPVGSGQSRTYVPFGHTPIESMQRSVRYQTPVRSVGSLQSQVPVRSFSSLQQTPHQSSGPNTPTRTICFTPLRSGASMFTPQSNQQNQPRIDSTFIVPFDM